MKVFLKYFGLRVWPFLATSGILEKAARNGEKLNWFLDFIFCERLDLIFSLRIFTIFRVFDWLSLPLSLYTLPKIVEDLYMSFVYRLWYSQ